MRAVIISDIENRESVDIRDIADPIQGDDEVLVDVKSCGINFTDLLSLDGKYQNNPPLPFTPGKDAAGIVAAVGKNVTSHKVGDRVLAHCNHGAMATKAVCHQALTCTLPDAVAFEDAAAMGLAHLTAYFALTRRGALQAGETVLINGASGGVGLAAVGLAKALGAKTVLAGLTSPGKADAIKKAGADGIIDLTTDDLKNSLRAQVADQVGKQGVNLVIDMLGGEIFEASLRAVADEGRAVVVGFASGTIPAVRTNYLLLKNISVVGMTVNSYMKARSPDIAKAQAALFDLLAAGKIDPNIMARLPFDQFRDGIRTLEDRKIVGKTVLVM
jgi:NADPH:quinone reductase